MPVVKLRRIALSAAAAVLAGSVAAPMVTVPTAASAAPATPSFSSTIDGYAAYDGQDTCDPTAKSGVTGFKDLLNTTYGSHTWGIGRACGSGGTSEHKEGRALDYHFDYYDTAQRADATDLLNWLLATDSYGNRHAMARRLGVMYVIWNNKIWKAYEASAGWQSYSGTNPHTDHIHFSFSWAGANKKTTWWNGGVSGNSSVYGVLADGRMTYSVIDAASGDRTFGPVTSTGTLGFTPKAMATLNFNTILVTSTAGKLYRVDVKTNNESLTFDPPVEIAATGWTQDLLAYDGAGNLFGIANGGELRRYGVTEGTHSFTVNSNTLIGSGFTLETLTATGTNWILGTTSAGVLRSYKINGVGLWDPATLDPDGWHFDHLMSPGGGVYYGVTPVDKAMYHYRDANPYDSNGSDIQYHLSDPVDTGGWVQTLLSAQPATIG